MLFASVRPWLATRKLFISRFNPFPFPHAFRFSTMPSRRIEDSASQPKEDLESLLFSSQSGKWLYNEHEQLSCRYMKWDQPALIDRACAVLEDECIQMAKIAEGSYNRVFLLTFKNNKEAILRIPCPLAGPADSITASEVATMQFAREVLDIPVPRVLDWNADPANPVGLPYILMENMSGISVLQRGKISPGIHGRPLFDELMAAEKSFAMVRFSQLGSLYFTEDVSTELQARPLFADDMDLSTEVLRMAANKYRIGPTVDRQWYRGARAAMKADRGPWPDFVSQCSAAIKLETAWLEHPASKTQPFRRKAMQSPRLNRSVLEMCSKVIPLIVPLEEHMQPILWHPDLSSSNILISATNEAHVHGVIDWQHAIVGPYAAQAIFPPVMAYYGDMSIYSRDKKGLPILPDNIDQRSMEEQDLAREQHRLATRHMLYNTYIQLFDSHRAATLKLPQSNALEMLPYHILRSWSDGVGPITDILLSLWHKWEAVVNVPGTPCPLDELTEAEIQEYRDAADQTTRYMNALEALSSELDSDGDGLVPLNQSTEAEEKCERLKREWDEDKNGGPFPYQDGGYSFFLS